MKIKNILYIKRHQKIRNILRVELTILIIKLINLQIFKLIILFRFKNLEKKYI